MKTLLTILLFFTLQACQAVGLNYYVKTGGSNNSVGTSDAQAWSFAYFQTQTLASGSTVYFRRGDVFTGTIIPQSGVSYDSYGTGAKPVINGWSIVTGWTATSGGRYEKVLTSYPTGLLNMVLFDGKAQGMGRYPKANLDEASYYKISGYSTTSDRWAASEGIINSNNISGIPNFVGGEVVYRAFPWIFSRGKVKTQSSTSVSYDAQQALNTPTGSYTPLETRGFFFQNHINTLSSLGEWCYDSTAHKITMFFGSENPSTHTVQIAALDSLCKIDSKSNITIQNISFTGANQQGIKLLNATNNKFINLDINYCGVYGIDGYGTPIGTRNNTVDGCYIQNCLSNGINANYSRQWYIRNSHIQNIGRIAGMGQSGDYQYMGIWGTDSASVIEYNEIDSIGYNGIYFTGPKDTIRYNHIHGYSLVKSDAAGINTFGNTGVDRLVAYNIVHDGQGDNFGLGEEAVNSFEELKKNVHGIYMDDNTQYVKIIGNTCFRNSFSGIFLHNTKNIDVLSNTCYDNTITQYWMLENQGNITFSGITVKNNIFLARQMGSLAMAFNAPVGQLSGVLLDSNVLARPILEPGNIDSTTIGYVTEPFTTYNRGGVIAFDFGNPSRFMSVDKWRLFRSKDTHSKKSPVGINNLDKIMFYYNTTASQITQNLGTKQYSDPLSRNASGSIVIQPFSSVLLLYNPPGLPAIKLGVSINANKNGTSITAIK